MQGEGIFSLLLACHAISLTPVSSAFSCPWARGTSATAETAHRHVHLEQTECIQACHALSSVSQKPQTLRTRLLSSILAKCCRCDLDFHNARPKAIACHAAPKFIHQMTAPQHKIYVCYASAKWCIQNPIHQRRLCHAQHFSSDAIEQS